MGEVKDPNTIHSELLRRALRRRVHRRRAGASHAAVRTYRERPGGLFHGLSRRHKESDRGGTRLQLTAILPTLRDGTPRVPGQPQARSRPPALGIPRSDLHDRTTPDRVHGHGLLRQSARSAPIEEKLSGQRAQFSGIHPVGLPAGLVRGRTILRTHFQNLPPPPPLKRRANHLFALGALVCFTKK